MAVELARGHRVRELRHKEKGDAVRGEAAPPDKLCTWGRRASQHRAARSSRIGECIESGCAVSGVKSNRIGRARMHSNAALALGRTGSSESRDRIGSSRPRSASSRTDRIEMGPGTVGGADP